MEQWYYQRPPRKFIVGLGNPGRDYRRTRHNVGFVVIDTLVGRWDADGPQYKFDAEIYQARPWLPGGEDYRAVLLKPMTFMNRSGTAVCEALRYHKASPDEALIVMDDLALPLGQLRFRQSGSAGGHKGLSDIIRRLGAEEEGVRLPRLRIGIGPLPAGADATDFVLKRFTKSETETIRRAAQQAAQAVEDWLFHGMTYVMNRYNAPQNCGEGD